VVTLVKCIPIFFN